MSRAFNRAIEEAKARGKDPKIIEAFRQLAEAGLVEVRQTEDGVFLWRVTEAGVQFVDLGRRAGIFD